MANRTRNKSSSHLSNYIGPGKDLVPSELPTVRDILRYGLLKRELSDQDKFHMEENQLVEMMVTALQEKWQRTRTGSLRSWKSWWIS